MALIDINDQSGKFGYAAIILAIGLTFAIITLSIGGCKALENSYIKFDAEKLLPQNISE